MPTPHNQAQPGQIAKTVLMPGDPLRAKYIAENYLEQPVCFNQVRNMLGYTGTYNGKEISVMGSGMGMPSIGIYSHELYTQYDVAQIIRIGSAGALQQEVHVRDLIIAMGASTNSDYPHKQLDLPGTFAPLASYALLRKAVEAAEAKGIHTVVGNVLSSDIFYNFDPTVNDRWAAAGILAVEMEAAALYTNAAHLGKQALCMLTISDHIYTGESLSPEARQTEFHNMMEVALTLA